MESRERIGLYGNGEIPRSARLMGRSVGPKSNGVRDLGSIPPIRKVRPRPAVKTVAAAAAAPLVAVLLVVTAVVLATSSAPVLEGGVQAPAPPYSLLGFTFDNSGAFLPDATCTITNLRTMEVINALSDSMFGLILSATTSNYPDLANEFPSGILDGDIIKIDAEKAGWTGTNQTTLANVDTTSSVWMNVTLSTPPIPEFGDVALPIVGMVGMFLVMAVATRSKKE